jgi:hypothetical protein
MMRALVVSALLAALVAGCSDEGGSSGVGTGGAGGGSTGTDATASSASGEGGDGGPSSGPTGSSSSGSSSQSGSTGVSSGSGGGGASSSGTGGAPATEIDGYWVWTRQIEDGAVTLEVTDADMEPRVGSSGWPGCPDGILCTRYGIHKVAFGENGRLHQQHNVMTSSDFQTLGTWADQGAGLGGFERQEQYSCAHPDSVNADVVPGAFRYRVEAGELWVSVNGFFGFAFSDPGVEPTTWLVYKPVSREDYYDRYMIRVCQPFDEFTCHEACFDDSLVDER